jgi:hypothetical protein
VRVSRIVPLLGLALLVPATASAQTYPEPADPGPVQTKPAGPHKTYTVCKRRGRCDFTTIQKAVDKARAGDTIRVRNGVYREAVRITGSKKRYLRLIGNPARPEKVLLRARGQMQNGFFVNEADEVTVDGFMTRGYKANGYFFTNVHGYTMNHLIARQTGIYGLYAFNSIGGQILNSEAYYVNDGAFYIGQTPPQSKPVQTIVRNVEGVGQPARLQRHQHALRDDHQEPLLQQRGRHRAERARLREVPAAREQRDRRQRHLLEQLQLP